MADRILNFNQPLDIQFLDSTVHTFYASKNADERAAAEKVLKEVQEHPDAWMRVDAILESSQVENTKFFALQILEAQIKFRWNILPAEQRDGIKNYVSNLIIKLCSDEALFRAQKVFINKLNIILVQVLKHEWPAKWKSFIPDLVGASKSSETLCENSMVILKLLSEEVFDFSRGEMTQAKVSELKKSLNSEFALIHELCEFVLARSQRVELVKTTLTTLHAFLSWIPLGYIFESTLVETLLKLIASPVLRNVCLQCLTEIGGLNVGSFYDQHFLKLYTYFMKQLGAMLPEGTNLAQAYADGTDDEEAFLQNLALFFSSFLKVHVSVLEQDAEGQQALLAGLQYLLNLSYIEDTEVFKVCLDYWHHLVYDLFQSQCAIETHASPTNASPFAFNGAAQAGPGAGAGGKPSRRQLYAAPMSKLRVLMISHMAKPEEVLIVEDENGNFVRETLKDNDVLVQYKIMRETLIFLSNLDQEDTEKQMLEKLAMQLNGKEWSWNNLNTLCWAIGSISGSMAEDQENRFLVTVIRDLLNLCEIIRGKEHKAVIASNIMYVVGQYPRFLRAHWKFLKTVVNKLFEFMHETHPGVQDMAVDTFLKITQKCKRKFVVLQLSEQEPFICELLTNLGRTVSELEPQQVHVFYEAVGHMIQAEGDPNRLAEYLLKLMEPPNTIWDQIIAQARVSSEVLKDHEVIRKVSNILRTNQAVATSLGQGFLPQISRIFLDMLNVYRMYSELVSQSIAASGKSAALTSGVKLLRTVKKDVLRLIETFVDKAEDVQNIAKSFVPAMLDPILGDYSRNVPDARDSEVLSLFATIVNKLQASMLDEIPGLFEAVFECTLQMITKNFEDYPDHRLKFFNLLLAITNHCFQALLQLTPQQTKLVMDSIIWAIRHTERNVAETGLNLLLQMLTSFQSSELGNQFYQSYLLELVQEIFAVLTDTFHKPGFKLHALILQHLFTVLEEGITVPLWDASKEGPTKYPNNVEFVRQYSINLLTTSFPNMTQAQVAQVIQGMFELKKDFSAFKNHLRDFLVQVGWPLTMATVPC